MLALNESTPIIMALCLLGSVLLIVGGSYWGSGDYNNDRQKTIAGIAMFSVSIVLLLLAGLGCWCNRFFCTPDRKSRIALRLYGSRPPLPAVDDDLEETESTDQRRNSKDPDWEEYAGSSNYRSFRSGRNSTRNHRSRASLRRDRVLPAQDSDTHQMQLHHQQPPPPPPPPPEQPLPLTPSQSFSPLNKQVNSYFVTKSIRSNDHNIVPVEYDTAVLTNAPQPRTAGYREAATSGAIREHHRDVKPHQQPLNHVYDMPSQTYSQNSRLPQDQRPRHPPDNSQAPLRVRPHMTVGGPDQHRIRDFRSPPPASNESANVSDPMVV